MKRKLPVIYAIAALLSVSVVTAAIAGDMPYDSMKMVKGSSGYLYEAYYQPTTAEGFAKTNALCKQLFFPAPGCSSVRKGNLYGRNFDYCFDLSPDVVIHTPADKTHFASITLDGGMLEKLINLTKQRLDEILAGDTPTDKEKQLMALLPYSAVDGINEKGLVCSVNVAQCGKDIEPTTGTNTGAELELYVALCTRYILDNCASTAEAIETLRNINIWASSDGSVKAEYHIMLADAKNTYVVEFKGNKMLVKEISHKPYMTNFNLLLSDSKTIYFDDKGHAVRESAINYGGGDYKGKFDQGNAHGFERYDLIADSYAGITDRASMRVVLDNVSSGQLYKNPKSRFTEFVRNNSKFEPYIPNMEDDFRYLTLKSATEDMDELCAKYNIESAMARLLDELERKARNYTHTGHSCIYDMDVKKVWVKEQELGKEDGAWSAEHCFSLNEDSSSRGCNAGFGLLALLLAAPLLAGRKKQ